MTKKGAEILWGDKYLGLILNIVSNDEFNLPFVNTVSKRRFGFSY
jgi:hypothetical protein